MFHAPLGRFQLESKLELPLFSGFTVVPIQLVVFVSAQTGRQKKLRHPTRPAEDVRTTKGLQERTQLIELEDGET